MERVELDKFWRKTKSDHSDYNQYQINNLIAFVIQENHNLQEVCETYKGLGLKFPNAKLKLVEERETNRLRSRKT
jgi:hypothetical protein